MNQKIVMRLGVSLVALFCFAQVNAAAPGGMGDKMASLKKALQQNQASLKQYEWVETVTVSKNGEQKSQKQFRCYYGLDGTLQKIPLASSQDDSQGGGRGFLRRKIMADKKQEMMEYMQSANALIKKYIPPQSALIQSAMEANKVSLKPSGDQNIEFVVQDYLLPGDSLDLGLNMGKPEVTALSVNSYLDNPKDTITLQVSFANLPDGTSYPKQTVMTTKKKDITVTTDNSGYKKMAN